MNLLFIDFEYCNTQESSTTLVCVSYASIANKTVEYKNRYWLLDEAEKLQAIEELSALLCTHLVVSYALQAEARSLMTLIPGLKPTDIRGIDLQLNYKMLLNHDDTLCYGPQLIDGKEVVTKKPKPKWDVRIIDEDSDSHQKAQASLSACTYKLLGIRIDTDRKDLMRNLIISADTSAIEAHKDEILTYCDSDIEHMPAILHAQFMLMRRHGFSRADIMKTWANLAEFACRSAAIEMLGYPINVPELTRLMSNIPKILNAAAKRVNEACPDIAPFCYSKKSDSYIKKEGPLVSWLEAKYTRKEWRQTDGGKSGRVKYSLSEDAFRDHYTTSSAGIGGEMLRYLSCRSSLNGFSPHSKKPFTEKLGSDGRSRPFGGTYGAQTSRSQPSSSHFLPLKSKWLRYLIQPKPGRAILGLDYSSQEFAISALISEDAKMCAAYKSGDVYLAFGKDAGIIPLDATKSSHKIEREVCKLVVLGTSYDMGGHGLAKRLTQFSGRLWATEEAQDLIDNFYSTYTDYAEWKEQTLAEYAENNFLRLSDGWTLFGDQDNFRSVGNFRVQGEAAVIMRRFVALAQDAGLDVIYTLHDAGYVELDSSDANAFRVFGEVMTQAFIDSFPSRRDEAKMTRLDGAAWSYDYATRAPEFNLPYPLTFSERYVDERGFADLQHYKQFL